jgi:hypothetical protein
VRIEPSQVRRVLRQLLRAELDVIERADLTRETPASREGMAGWRADRCEPRPQNLPSPRAARGCPLLSGGLSPRRRVTGDAKEGERWSGPARLGSGRWVACVGGSRGGLGGDGSLWSVWKRAPLRWMLPKAK